MEINKFNIRVYGILINSDNQVLICDELIKGIKITKFPGGGLEFGEGTIDCIKREFMEETNNEIEIVQHFYTTDYFQISAYNSSHQIISIYYIVKPIGEFKIDSKEDISFRWIELKDISENDFTLPIDKIVGKMLNEE
jgi:8-oxo-dGTP pyrophosphatase MutT (NUDIX family)